MKSPTMNTTSMKTFEKPARRLFVAVMSAILIQLAIALPSKALQFPIATSSGTELTFSAAFNGTNYLAAILGDGSSGANITAQLVSPAGSPVGARIQTGRTGTVPGGLPLVAYGSNTYLMVWQDNAGATDLTYGQLISRAGALQGAAFAVSTHASAKQGLAPPGVPFDGSQFLVV